MKFTDPTCAFKDLTNFECEAIAIAGNGSYVNLQKLKKPAKNVIEEIREID